MAKTKVKPDRYKRVPVQNEWLSDEEIPTNPIQRYDWVGIGDKAITKPGQWLLVDKDGTAATASNITQRRIAALNGERFVEYTFRGRLVGYHVTETGTRRGEIWIKAEHVGLRP